MKIEFIKQVIFKDMHGSIVKIYKIGDIVEFSCKTSTYYVTSMGGIYFDEALETIK